MSTVVTWTSETACECCGTDCTSLIEDCDQCPYGVQAFFNVTPWDRNLVLIGQDASGIQPDATLVWDVGEYKTVDEGLGPNCSHGECCWGRGDPFFPEPNFSNSLRFYYNYVDGWWEIELATAAGNFPIGYSYVIRFKVLDFVCCETIQVVNVEFISQDVTPPLGAGSIPPYGYQSPLPTQFQLASCRCPSPPGPMAAAEDIEDEMVPAIPSVTVPVAMARTAETRAELRSPCTHLGGPTGDKVSCRSCGGRVELKLFTCDVYTTCTVGKKVPDVACCAGCEDYEPVKTEAEIIAPPLPVTPFSGKRHLAMHVYPSQGNNTWRRSLDQVRARWGVFTGTKAIAVVYGPDLTDWQVVRDYCDGWGADVFPIPNLATLREVATWEPLWDRILPTADDKDITLYCHAKGTTRAVQFNMLPIHRWASLMWTLYLDYLPDIERMLRQYPIVGCFKKIGYGFGRTHGRWHYSGSFFWSRVGDFRERRYAMKPPAIWYGAEAWPGMAYDSGEAGVFYRSTPVSKTNLYSMERWRDIYMPEYAEWLAERKDRAITRNANQSLVGT